MTEERTDVLIIGAGLAGLTTDRELVLAVRFGCSKPAIALAGGYTHSGSVIFTWI